MCVIYKESIKQPAHTCDSELIQLLLVEINISFKSSKISLSLTTLATGFVTISLVFDTDQTSLNNITWPHDSLFSFGKF